MTSSIEAAVYLDRSDGIFRVGEKVAGVVELTCAKAIRHEGFELLAEGIVHLQAAARNISVFESQNGSTKPIRIFQAAITLLSPGKIPVGFSRYPFEFELSAQNQIYGKLLETYHGVYISIRYEIICQVVLGGWRKNVEANVEFVVHCPTATPGAGITPKPVQFTLTPQSLVNVRTTSRIPDFLIRGRLDKDLQNLAEPITGEITVERCDCPVLSIELQLIRVETCSFEDIESREPTEIQNIQIGDGDVVRGFSIPMYMVLPRIFTCSTTITRDFKVEFELNILIVLQDNLTISENFSIRFYR